MLYIDKIDIVLIHHLNGERNMGMNGSGWDGSYAKKRIMGGGTDKIEANDFKAANFGAAAGMMALIALASGCIDLDRKLVMSQLVKDGDFGGKVDAELKAVKMGDSMTYDNGQSGGRYDVMFRGIGPDGKAHFDILKGNTELKHFAVGNYEKPDTYEKMMNVTDKIMAGQSTDSVALLKFEGIGRWEMLAYAYIKNGSEVDLKLVDAFRG